MHWDIGCFSTKTKCPSLLSLSRRSNTEFDHHLPSVGNSVMIQVCLRIIHIGLLLLRIHIIYHELLFAYMCSYIQVNMPNLNWFRSTMITKVNITCYKKLFDGIFWNMVALFLWGFLFFFVFCFLPCEINSEPLLQEERYWLGLNVLLIASSSLMKEKIR